MSDGITEYGNKLRSALIESGSQEEFQKVLEQLGYALMMEFGLSEAEMEPIGMKLMERGVDFSTLVYDMSEEGLERINNFVNVLEDILVYMGASKTQMGGEKNENVTPEKIEAFMTQVEAFMNGANSATTGALPSDEEVMEWL